MEITAVCIVAFLALRTFISLVNLLSRLYLPDQKPLGFPKISVLIPARNEESVIGCLLNSLKMQDYPNLEVIVCNDHSSDNTEEILNRFAGENKWAHGFLGEKLAPDWLGKNWACHQLAQKASGQYLIFMDADVVLHPNAISRAVAYFQRNKLVLLSVFPQQKMESLFERMTVPLMNWILQSLLPLILVRKARFASLSAANGQFMMFDAENYRQNQWHSKVRNQNVEDLRLARMIKSEGHKMAILLGNNDIFCRMYRQLDEALLGFSRNVHEYFGGSRIVMFSFWFIIGLGPFIVIFSATPGLFGLFGLLVLANRLFVSVSCKQNVLFSVLSHPLQMIGFTAIVFYNIFRKLKKETTWKERKIRF